MLHSLSVPSYQGICHLCREEKLAMQYCRKQSQRRRQTIVDQAAIQTALGISTIHQILSSMHFGNFVQHHLQSIPRVSFEILGGCDSQKENDDESNTECEDSSDSEEDLDETKNENKRSDHR